VVVLPQALSTGWLLLALPLGVYVVAVHLLRLRGVPKELLVGLFFAIAVTMPVLVTGVGASRNVGMPALAFGMVCWLNCRAIATWETGAVEGGRFVRCCVLAGAMALLLMGTGGEATWIGAALLLSSVALLWLHRGRHGLQRVHLRALADAALLTPLLLWPLLPR
jgi:hypothetical protein